MIEKARAAIRAYLDVDQEMWSDVDVLERAMIDAKLSSGEAAALLVEQANLEQPHEHIIADVIVAALLHERMPEVHAAYRGGEFGRWYV